MNTFSLKLIACDKVFYDAPCEILIFDGFDGEMAIMADLDWTIEAIINVMKNCIEHNEGGTVYCSYKQNPIYTEICIWDEGEGFAKEDIPHLFERFYRGKNAGEGGIGIGLALAK